MRISVDCGAYRLAINALRRAGKNEIADELENTSIRYDDTEIKSLINDAPKFFSHHEFDGEKLKWIENAKRNGYLNEL